VRRIQGVEGGSAIDENARQGGWLGRDGDLPRSRDLWLVRRAKRGAPDAVEALVRRHWPRAHRTALLIVHDVSAAEDIAQEAMLAAVGSLDRFDLRRPLGPWLHRIVVTRALDHVRATKRRGEVGGEVLEELVSDDVQIGLDSEGASVAQALGRLDPVDRAIVILRHLLDYRSREIAGMLDMPATTVRTRLRRAITQVREELEQTSSVGYERTELT
jgi:RNA polymerase sigma-70 factor (ECF subfamily)